MKTTIAKTIRDRILSCYPRTEVEITTTALGKPMLRVTTDHGKADPIGQLALRTFPEAVETYFACHVFRRASLSIYLKGKGTFRAACDAALKGQAKV